MKFDNNVFEAGNIFTHWLELNSAISEGDGHL